MVILVKSLVHFGRLTSDFLIVLTKMDQLPTRKKVFLTILGQKAGQNGHLGCSPDTFWTPVCVRWPLGHQGPPAAQT